jgi:hypothetical protein
MATWERKEQNYLGCLVHVTGCVLPNSKRWQSHGLQCKWYSLELGSAGKGLCLIWGHEIAKVQSNKSSMVLSQNQT